MLVLDDFTLGIFAIAAVLAFVVPLIYEFCMFVYLGRSLSKHLIWQMFIWMFALGLAFSYGAFVAVGG